ncbi:MAG: hypothetical protein GTO03_09345 [Planctomycetales bacterium]|nr:hypothetical protein [Planctomycetales bacterium]
MFQVPPEGILLDLPHLRFENIDFVWNHPGTTAETPPAMIRMTSRWIEFHQCSFQSGRVPFGSLRPVAVACRPADRAPGAVDLPAASHVVLDRSVFRDVEAAIASATAVTLQSNGSLYLGPGPVLDLANWPTGKQPVRLALSQCTLRNATALVWVRGGQVPRRPQAIVINAESSVFAPRADGALLFFETLHDPHDLLSRVQWTGHSSLLSADATLVAGSSAEGEAQRLDESQVAIEGLARSHCEFAGPQIDLPAASRLEHWSVPLRASATPGIDPGILQLPHVPTQ